MSLTSQFLLAVVCGWSSLIDIAHSTYSDPSIFFPDDFMLTTTDYSSTEAGLSFDLLSGSDSLFDQADLNFSPATDAISATLDPERLSFGDSDPTGLEASCAGGSGPQTFGKVRRENGQICSHNPPKTNPDFSNLKFPDFMQIEQTLENVQAEPDAQAGTASGDDNINCPEPYGRHVCCTGPGIRGFSGPGMWDAVQGCEPCMYLIKIPVYVSPLLFLSTWYI